MFGRPMSEREVASWVRRNHETALNRADSDISDHRQALLDYYMGEAYGDERQGKSSVVTRECFETVEWILPDLIEIFLAGSNVAMFIPESEEDEDAAAQDTDVINYLVLRSESAYALFAAWFRDVLIYPVGYCKVYWDTVPEYTLEQYEGLTELQLVALYQDTSVSIVSVEPRQAQLPPVSTPQGLVPPRSITVYDVTVRETAQDGKLRLDPVPPEEVLVAGNASSWNLDEADYVEHFRQTPKSDLVGMGLDPDYVAQLSTSNYGNDTTERRARNRTHNEDPHYSMVEGAMEEVDYHEAYGKLDVDGDGFAEYVRVVMVANDVIEIREVDHQPLIGMSWVPNPHRHIGTSAVDVTMQTQRTNSVQTRQGLDNLYRTNNPRTFVDIKSNRVNTEQLANYEPDGYVEVEGSPQQAVSPEGVPVVLTQVLAAIEHQDKKQERRVGVSEAATTIDPDVLAKSTLGAAMLATSGHNQRQQMTARHFAETGVRQLMLKVHHLMRTRQRINITLELRGTWVNVNPRSWKRRTSMRVLVGIGAGNRRERLATAMQTYNLQTALLPQGLTTTDRMYNTLEDISDILGHSSPNRYWLDPNSDEAEHRRQLQDQQTQQQAAAQARPQAEVIELEKFRARDASHKWQAELEANVNETSLDHFARTAEAELKYDTDIKGAGQGA